nr:hypothetical protein [Streptomyces antibioticus]
MAAGRFVQIANRLFRDPHLSFKAKELSGLISTQRDGWRIAVTNLARNGRDGETAVKSGLKGLEQHSFLLRERTRNVDGTLGGVAYVITDRPDGRACRSQPVSGFPPVDEPTSADRPPKNTNRKKTNQQNTNPLPPRPHLAAKPPSGTRRADGDLPPAPPADELHPAVRLPLDIAADRPEFLLTGAALTDQGRVATVMLEAGWSSEHLRHVIADRPLPNLVHSHVTCVLPVVAGEMCGGAGCDRGGCMAAGSDLVHGRPWLGARWLVERGFCKLLCTIPVTSVRSRSASGLRVRFAGRQRSRRWRGGLVAHVDSGALGDQFGCLVGSVGRFGEVTFPEESECRVHPLDSEGEARSAAGTMAVGRQKTQPVLRFDEIVEPLLQEGLVRRTFGGDLVAVAGGSGQRVEDAVIGGGPLVPAPRCGLMTY